MTLTRDWISVNEAAEYLGVHPMTIHRYIKQGILEAQQFERKGRIRISASSVEKRLEASKIKPETCQ